MESLGDRLKQLILENGISQKQLAKRVGCSDVAISHYIKGDQVPRSSVLTKIAIALNTTSDYLMEGIPTSASEEINQAKRLIARNAIHMTIKEKKDIINILLTDDSLS